MRLLVATYGTEGDTRPFAALCRGLIDAGHEARLLADAATLGSAHALDVPAAALAGDIRTTVRREIGAAAADSRGSSFGATAGALARIANEHAESWLASIIEAGRGCDIILATGLAAFAALSAAEHLGVRAVGAGMIPMTPTSAFPSPLLSHIRPPRFLNRTSHHIANALLWRAFRTRTDAARAQFSLPPLRAVWKGLPVIYGISPQLLARPADWPPEARLCGQWLAHHPAWSPPPELAQFLAAGEAPVYVGFGSMTGFDPARIIAALDRALAGRRALFQAGWSGIDPKSLPGNFLLIGETPHDWLFPRTAAVLHHGGSGTSHSAARAGVPSIVVPFAADQFFWARRLQAAGVAPDRLDLRRPEAAAFARAFDFAATAQARRNARALGERMQAEDGVSRAVAALEAMGR